MVITGTKITIIEGLWETMKKGEPSHGRSHSHVSKNIDKSVDGVDQYLT